MFHWPRKFYNKVLSNDNIACYIIPNRNGAPPIHAKAFRIESWEIVAVSKRLKGPSITETRIAINFFWDIEDVVMQIHYPHVRRNPTLLKFALLMRHPQREILFNFPTIETINEFISHHSTDLSR